MNLIPAPSFRYPVAAANISADDAVDPSSRIKVTTKKESDERALSLFRLEFVRRQSYAHVHTHTLQVR